MHYPELARCVDFFKHDNKGVSAMCEIMEKLQDEGRVEGRQEGLAEGRSQIAIKMLQKNEPIEKIVEYTSLSNQQVQELAQQIQ